MSPSPRSRRARPVARWAVSVVGLSILAGIPVRWLVYHHEPLQHFFTREHLVELAFTGSFAVLVLLVGVALARGHLQLPPDAPARVARRSIVGLVGFAAIVAALLILGETVTADEFTYYTLFAASVGGAVGLLFGMLESYTVRNAREVERRSEAVRRVEGERARLEYLNHVLRHEVLNNVSIIGGYADLALEGPADERPDEYLATIRDQSAEMAGVIQDVRTLLDALQETDEERFGPVDLAGILTAEIEGLRDSYEGVTVTIDVPEDASVRADHLVARVFGNLLSNAVQHNDAASPRVDVTVERTPDTVRVRIADDGPGIPASKRETLFERSGRGDHGLGLYLVRTIADRYGGTVELTETGNDGSVFTVTLPRWTDEVRTGPRADGPATASDATSDGRPPASFRHVT